MKHLGGATCSKCGKRSYISKGEAKAAAKRIRGRVGKVHPYKCGDYWHLGHLPKGVVAGDMARAEIEPARRRTRTSRYSTDFDLRSRKGGDQ